MFLSLKSFHNSPWFLRYNHSHFQSKFGTERLSFPPAPSLEWEILRAHLCLELLILPSSLSVNTPSLGLFMVRICFFLKERHYCPLWTGYPGRSGGEEEKEPKAQVTTVSHSVYLIYVGPAPCYFFSLLLLQGSLLSSSYTKVRKGMGITCRKVVGQ